MSIWENLRFFNYVTILAAKATRLLSTRIARWHALSFKGPIRAFNFQSRMKIKFYRKTPTRAAMNTNEQVLGLQPWYPVTKKWTWTFPEPRPQREREHNPHHKFVYIWWKCSSAIHYFKQYTPLTSQSYSFHWTWRHQYRGKLHPMLW